MIGFSASFPCVQLGKPFCRQENFTQHNKKNRTAHAVHGKFSEVYTLFSFYKQLHFGVQPGVALAFYQSQPQSCLMVA